MVYHEHNPSPPKCSHPLFPLGSKCSSLWTISVHSATSDKQCMLWVKCLVPRPPTLFLALGQRHPMRFSLAIITILINLTLGNMLSFCNTYCLTVGLVMLLATMWLVMSLSASHLQNYPLEKLCSPNQFYALFLDSRLQPLETGIPVVMWIRVLTMKAEKEESTACSEGFVRAMGEG